MFPMVQRYPGAHHYNSPLLSPYPPHGPEHHHHDQSFLPPQGAFALSSGNQVALPHRGFQNGGPQPSMTRAGPQRSKSIVNGPILDEHRLRRKTPNGTIEAGYDGNPVELASRPPPFKQMVIPGSNQSGSASVPRYTGDYSLSHQSLLNGHFYAPDTSFGAVAPPRGSRQELSPPSLIPGWSMGPGPTIDCAPNLPSTAYQTPNNGIRIPTALQPMHQQPLGPAIFNPGGLLPPAWHDANPGNFHPGTPAVSYFGMPGYLGQFQPPPYHSRATAVPYETPGSFQPVIQNGSIGPFQTTSQRLESLTLEPHHDPLHESRPQHAQNVAGFRDRALENAHKTYIELIAYLHSRKKLSQNQPEGSKKSQSKMIIFPKLPKPWTQPALAMVRHPTHTTRASASFHPEVLAGTPAHRVAIHQRHHSTSDNFTSRPENSANPAFYHLFNGGASNFPRRYDSSTPLVGAKAALDMLTTLCEQSGWKWIDGILLGACLHYGLDNYEQALEWFKTIVSLEPDHIEAISNIAATLYGLNRQEEAENQWRYAVQKRPDYLEAAEHLVGLLCSHSRTREAVDIVNFVQRSLRQQTENCAGHDTSASQIQANQSRLDSGRLHHGSVNIAALEAASSGFSSSGYMIPGSENGRMIALIHAKGNLLYALKDIDAASSAFEEVVLISAGRDFGSVHSLIWRVKTVLAPPDYDPRPPSGPLLLPPEIANQTAHKVFGSNGSHTTLPGLRFVTEGVPSRSAVSTTSNSLLSLAKIFQDSMSSGSSYLKMPQASGVGEILALYYLSLSLSASPSTANNIGILLAGVQQPQSATAQIQAANVPNIAGIAPGSGLALAYSYYQYGLSLDSRHVHLHTNLGSLLKDAGQLDRAIWMYEKAVQCDGTFDIALTNLANAVKDRGRVKDAILYYRRAVQSNPQFAEAVCGLSTALNSVCDWQGRGGVLLQGGKLDRWHVNDEGILEDVTITGSAGGLMKKVVDIVTRQLGDAAQWGLGSLQHESIDLLAGQLQTISLDKGDRTLDIKHELRSWAGQKWEGSRILRLVERAVRIIMWNWYQDRYVHKRTSEKGYRRPRLPNSLSVPSAPTVLPFHTFTCPLTAKDVRLISQRNAARISCSTLKAPWLSPSVYPPPPPPMPYLNIGYVSSDFNNHPLAHLMQSVFGFHDPSRAKAFCYATTPSDGTEHRLQIEREAPVFRDVSSWSSERMVDQIVKDQIHILVNLNGYTRGARNEVFAARPAPIQMSFMGFAGTLGAEWCDYLLADETAIPTATLRPIRDNLNLKNVFEDEQSTEAEDWMYPENIIFCRDTFFCCDHAQSCGPDERSITWEKEQTRRWDMRRELFPDLSDDTIIMGNFNQLYKIEPTTFRTWLRILRDVPNSILWLLKFPELGEQNLKRTAVLWASEEIASRIRFTEVAPKQQHIARARVCDLFLDTPECNGHTTAADVLWSSTPLLTLPRYEYKMCSRMAASILKGALPKSTDGEQAARELIAANDEQYEATAIKLAKGLTYHGTNGSYREGRGRLAEMRKILFDAKWTCALFDTRRWVRDLEEAYDEAWRRWVAGEGGDIHL